MKTNKFEKKMVQCYYKNLEIKALYYIIPHIPQT